MDDSPYARLASFRRTWSDGDTIDKESGLTAADLDTILEDRKRAKAEEVAANLGDLA